MSVEELQDNEKTSLPPENVQSCSTTAPVQPIPTLITFPIHPIAVLPIKNIPLKKKIKNKKPNRRKSVQRYDMPQPDWSADYSYTPYEHAIHHNAIRQGSWNNTWRDNIQPIAYHRDHPYGYVDPHQNYPHNHNYPSTSGFFSSPPTRHGYLKRKYPVLLGAEIGEKQPSLNLRADISSQKIVIKWDPYPGRKDVFYKVVAVCISSECNFQSTTEGNRWTFEQPFTQTQRILTTTPGNIYRITVECKEIVSGINLSVEEEEFKACMNMAEHEAMYNKAVAFAGHSIHFFDHIYRCKPKFYWDYIHLQNYDLMEKYIKDNNGQAANQINGRIYGLFFSARLAPDGTLPNTSPFGDVRMLVQAERLLDPMKHNFYFADFYCNYITHYVTVVVCPRGTNTDRFCSERCYKMDIFQNPFLQASSVWDPNIYGYRHSFYVSKKVWVEIYYTENIHLNIGRFSNIIATGAGTSKIGGLPNNKYCFDCNLYPIVPDSHNVPVTVSILKDFGNDDGLNAFDVTVDFQSQSSTLSILCALDKTGLDDIWDDLVEVVCSVVDGACEMQVLAKEGLPVKGDVIERGHKEVDQLIKSTEQGPKTNVIMIACPKLQEAWTAIKQHAENMKSFIAGMDEKLSSHQSSSLLPSLDITVLSVPSINMENSADLENQT